MADRNLRSALKELGLVACGAVPGAWLRWQSGVHLGPLLGGAAIVFRTLQLALTQDLRTGLVWATKILTDPFHDVKLYHRSPLHLLRGELVDPMVHTSESR